MGIWVPRDIYVGCQTSKGSKGIKWYNKGCVGWVSYNSLNTVGRNKQFPNTVGRNKQFPITVGMHQGSVPSSYLFALVMIEPTRHIYLIINKTSLKVNKKSTKITKMLQRKQIKVEVLLNNYESNHKFKKITYSFSIATDFRN